MIRNHYSLILKIALFVSAAFLLCNAVLLNRDYQDSWILAGLEAPFAIFVVVLLLNFFTEKKVSWLMAFAIVGHAVFLLVPNLKYVWFQGIWVDQHQQYALASYVVQNGRIATTGSFFVSVYGATPLYHLLLSVFSIFLNVPVVDAMKYVPVLTSPLYPLLIYGIMKKLKMPGGPTGLRYVLLFSAFLTIPIYTISGTDFGTLFVLIALYLAITLIECDDKRFVGLYVFSVIILSMAHNASSILFAVFILCLWVLKKFRWLGLRDFPKTGIVLVTLLLFLGGWLFLLVLL